MNDSLTIVNIRLFATSCFQLVEIHQLLSGCIDRFLSMTSRPVHTSLVRAASPLLLIMCPLISMHYISHWFLRVKLMSNALVPLHSSAGFSYVHQLHWRLPIDLISCMIILLFPNCIISSAVLPFPKNCYRASLQFYMFQCHNEYFTAWSCKSVSKQVSTADWHQSRSTPMMCQYSLQMFCSKYVLLYKSRPKLQHIIHSWLCSVVQLRYVPYVSYFFHSLTLVTYLAHS